MGGERKTIRHFTDLEVWRVAHKLEIKIYTVTKGFPKDELFGLTSQLRRAAASIGANIAEGMGRGSYADRCRFYLNARGSVYEVENFLILSRDLKYIVSDDFFALNDLVTSVRRLLNAFISKTHELS